MEKVKELFYIMFEMCLAIFIAIFGYAIWDNFNLEELEIAKSNDNIKEVEILLEDNTLYVHNIGKNINNVDLMIKVDKNVLSNTDNLVLEIDNKKYNLKELNCNSDDKYNYYNLYEIDFESYETKNYKVNINSSELIEYEFITI